MAVAAARPAVHRREPHRHGRQSREQGWSTQPPTATRCVHRAELTIGASLYKKLPLISARHRRGRGGDAVPEPHGGLAVAAGGASPSSSPMPKPSRELSFASSASAPRCISPASCSSDGEGRHGARALSRLGRRYPDLISGRVQVLFDNLAAGLELVRGGKVRALGVTPRERWPRCPICRPSPRPCPASRSTSGTACMRRGRRRADRRRAQQGGECRARGCARQGAHRRRRRFTHADDPAEFGQFTLDDIEKWRKVVEFAGVLRMSGGTANRPISSSIGSDQIARRSGMMRWVKGSKRNLQFNRHSECPVTSPIHPAFRNPGP